MTRSRSKQDTPVPQLDGPVDQGITGHDIACNIDSCDLNVNKDSHVTVWGARYPHDLMRNCYACDCSISNDQIIQCCFQCDSMFCIPCLTKGVHDFHWGYLHNPKPLSQYMIKPQDSDSSENEIDTGQ